MMIDLIPRSNVSDTVAVAVRTMIIDGRLPENERINEVRLSEALGVSRTPLREALSRLATEGALTNVPSLGYFVRPLTLEECNQLYAIRPLLDPEALRLAGLPSKPRLEVLEQLNQAFADAGDPDQAIAFDNAWHLELIAGCPNAILLELIGNIINRTRRYEVALMRARPNVVRANQDHLRILSRLGAGDLDGACAALKHNMQSGVAPIAAWLQSRLAGGF